MNFTGFVQRLYEWGIADVLLPFLLIFTIVFAVMQKSEILGKDKKNFNVIIALVMGLAIVFPHVLGYYPSGSDPIDIINNALPNVSLVLVIIMMFLLMIGLMGGQIKWLGGSISGWIAIISFLVVLYIFGRATGWQGFTQELPSWLMWLDDPDVMAFIIILLVFGILVWFITKDDTTKKTSILNDLTTGLGQLFKK